MDSYDRLLMYVRKYGEPRTDRTGTGTISLFNPPTLETHLKGNRVPLVTSKAVPVQMALRELFWQLSGSTNINDLAKSSPKMAEIWANWADKDGSIGPTYGAQYRNAGGSLSTGTPRNITNHLGQQVASADYGVDQLRQTIFRLAETPDTRRAVISLWSAPELEAMALEPCMVLFQFSLRGTGFNQLDLSVYQRSADLMLGVPFDLFQAGVLMHLVAREVQRLTGRSTKPGRMVWQGGDVHIYNNQLDAVDQQLDQARQLNLPLSFSTISIDPFPTLSILDGTLEPGHVRIHGYSPAPHIAAPLAV